MIWFLYPKFWSRMGGDDTVDAVTKSKVQTTVLLSSGQEAEIRRLCVEWGDASLSSVVRRLLAEALDARKEPTAVAS